MRWRGFTEESKSFMNYPHAVSFGNEATVAFWAEGD